MVLRVEIEQTGGPEVLRLVDRPLPPPGKGEIQIEHAAVGVNFIDTYHRTGLYKTELPTGLGLEAAGTVTAVGDGVTAFAPGDRVAYAGGPLGAYAEARNLPADRVLHLPDDVGFAAAAAGLLKGMTVEFLTHRTFEVKPGTTVLWHAAAGGVGLLACQWLRALGARVLGTVGTDEKAALARHHGCDEPIVYTREDVVSRVRELTDGRGVDVVYDSVGAATFAASLDCLRPRGMLVGFGNASGPPGPFDPMDLARRGSLYLTRASLFDYTRTREELELSAGRFFAVLGRGEVQAEPRQRFPLKNVADAHRALAARATTGSTVLEP